MDADRPLAETELRPDGAVPSTDGAASPVIQELAELQKLMEFGRQHVEVRLAQVRTAIRRAIWKVVFTAFAGVVVLMVLGASTCLLLAGAAAGLADVTGLPLWAGRVLAAGGTLAAAFGALALWHHRRHARAMHAAASAFEARRRLQRALFGEDVEHAAQHQN